ncbi:MAG: flagellar hook-length control protein FliK [Betaproteobacteria bacterium]|nr:flagellar hook-length control protein FliK [Betaproteobacteria bacterium]
MLNISIAPQNLSPVENSAAAMNSGSSGTKDPVTKDFGKVLEREVSETANKQEKHGTAKARDRSENDVSSKDKKDSTADSSTDAPADDAGSFIQNLLIDAPAVFKTIPSLQASPDLTNAASALPSDIPLPQDSQQIPGTVIAASALPQTATSALPGTLLPQENQQIASATTPVANQMLQQNQNQAGLNAINVNATSNNYWQFLGAADSAAYGKFVPSATGLGEDIQLDDTASIFKTQEVPITSQSFGVSGATAASPQNAVPQDVKIDAPVGQHKWNSEFSQKIVWLSTQQHQVAEIRLNPAHLGPVEVMLSITQDQATAQFVSPHSAVRDAIQEALPRLREMMAENGIQLGNVMVGADSFQQESKQQQAFFAAKGASGMNNAGQEAVNSIQTITMPANHQGLVNTYA